MSTPRISKLSGTITWSDGSNFNGFATLGLVFPTSSGTAWPELTLEPHQPRQVIPTWSTIPINDGEFNQALGVWFTADINPPNTKYCIYYFDTSGKRVGSPSTDADFFTVTADPTTPTTYTLTVPIAGTAVPSAE